MPCSSEKEREKEAPKEGNFNKNMNWMLLDRGKWMNNRKELRDKKETETETERKGIDGETGAPVAGFCTHQRHDQRWLELSLHMIRNPCLSILQLALWLVVYVAFLCLPFTICLLHSKTYRQLGKAHQRTLGVAQQERDIDILPVNSNHRPHPRQGETAQVGPSHHPLHLFTIRRLGLRPLFLHKRRRILGPRLLPWKQLHFHELIPPYPLLAIINTNPIHPLSIPATISRRELIQCSSLSVPPTTATTAA